MHTKTARLLGGTRRAILMGPLLFGVLAFCSTEDAWAQANNWQTANPNIFFLNGNVGIGTATPQAPLHVLQTFAGVSMHVESWNQNANLRLRRANGTGTTAVNDGDALGILSFSGYGTNGFSAGSAKIQAQASNPGSFWTDASQGSFLTFWTTPIGSAATSSAERVRIDPFGRVGIGTQAPAYPLDVVAGPVQNVVMRLWGQQGSISDNVQLRFAGQKDGEMWAIGSDVAAGGSTKDFEFYDLTAGATRLAINSSGNVGIGTTNPTSLLHVAGSITASGLTSSGGVTVNSLAGITVNNNGGISAPGGTISGMNVVANYQDVAEWVPASMKMQAGTVVVIDAQVNNHVSPSSTAYDTRVAGVISANPGVILGQRGEDKVMVATTGRVRVRVDATRAPIRVGDLLATSDKEGVAMRSMPVDLGGTPIHRPGTLIGKALEPLASGTGEILVLLSLQ